ncbi:MAG: hypothetical protein R3D00_00950 [Bacteroidia bacterium]
MNYNLNSVLLCFSICTISLSAYSQTFDTPIAYHNFIAEHYNIISAKHIAYVSYSVHSEDDSEIENRRNDVIQQIILSRDSVLAITPYKDEKKLKDIAISVFDQYLEVFQLEFSDAIDLKRDSKNSYEAMEKFFQIQDRAQEKLAKASDRFDLAELEFAGKYQLKFEEKDQRIAWKLKMISEVTKYTNEFFLHYFQVIKADAAFKEAWDKKNPEQMEKAKSELLKAASSAYTKIQSRGYFDGKKEFYDATLDLVGYYKKLASSEYSQLTEVIKNFEKRTSEQVANYNKIVNSIPGETKMRTEVFNSSRRALQQKYIPDLTDTKSMKY